MSQYQTLANVPTELLDVVKDQYNKADLLDQSMFVHYTADEFQDYIMIDNNHALYKVFEDLFGVSCKLSFLSNPPLSGLGPVHTDGSRTCCINFPLEVDLNNSCFFIAREGEQPTVRPPHPGEPVNPTALRFEYEPEKYFYYNLKTPIAFSTKVAHGVYNYSKDRRVLLSAAFDMSYNDLLNIIPESWY